MKIRSTALALALLLGAPSLAAPQVALTMDEAKRELVITVGPVDLPAAAAHHAEAAHAAHGAQPGHGQGGHHGGAIFPPIGTVTIPFDVYVHGFRFVVVDGQGNQLPNELLHHVNLINASKRELFLPISQRLLALGNETAPKSVPVRLIGVPVDAGTQIVVAAMLHNPTGVRHDAVELKIYLEYRAAEGFAPRFAVQPFQMDIEFPAGDKSVDLPPGRSEWSWEGSPAVEGQILVVGGHLHELAEAIRLEDVTEGRLLWEGRPVLDSAGNLIDVTLGRLYQQTAAARLYPDHVYRVTAIYNNPTGDTLAQGGMGVVAGVFAPADSAVWPDADTANTLYVLDRMHYMREVRGTYEEIVRLVEGKGGAAAHRHEQPEKR